MVGGVFIVSNTDISVCATSEGSPVYKQEALTTYYSDSDLRNIANGGDHQWRIQEFHNPGRGGGLIIILIANFGK